jgi:hypothetical protein
MAGEGARRRLVNGVPLAYVRELAGYWEKSYDMQRVADRLNRYEQFVRTIDGVDIHFLGVRSRVEGATPQRLADPAKLIEIHVNWALADPTKLMELGGPSEEEQRYSGRDEPASHV